MADELKTYKVLKRLGWGGGTYLPNDVVEMPQAWGNYYVKEEVLEEMRVVPQNNSTPNSLINGETEPPPIETMSSELVEEEEA